ncbi:MAG: GntR family transcriptional regulator [Bacteroidota bacterium]|nr:GntR family transcriptional regulator [Bacteroidota bacterium]MDP4204650.1 GntR family transcriptional regulator [Bacteroidota bacterium]
MIAQSQKIPQYRKLYETLRRHITSGHYPEGALLPSENELCTIHGMTRPTVRQALDKLVKDGYIIKHQGKGSIVNKLPRDIGILSIHGTTSAVGRDYLKTQIIVKPQIQNWESPFFFDLSAIERESGCLYMERLRLVNEVPVFYDINHIPNINLPRFTSRNFEDRSLFEILRQHYQIEITSGEQKIRAIEADKKIAHALKVQEGHPILYLERKLITNRPGFSIYSTIYFNSANHSIYGSF